jgi:hypothetical protein
LQPAHASLSPADVCSYNEATNQYIIAHKLKGSSEMSTANDYLLVREIATACYGMQARIELVTHSNNPVFRLRFGDASKILKFANREQAIRKELMLIELLTVMATWWENLFSSWKVPETKPSCST